jgi:hypothetical protein
MNFWDIRIKEKKRKKGPNPSHRLNRPNQPSRTSLPHPHLHAGPSDPFLFLSLGRARHAQCRAAGPGAWPPRSPYPDISASSAARTSEPSSPLPLPPSSSSPSPIHSPLMKLTPPLLELMATGHLPPSAPSPLPLSFYKMAAEPFPHLSLVLTEPPRRSRHSPPSPEFVEPLPESTEPRRTLDRARPRPYCPDRASTIRATPSPRHSCPGRAVPFPRRAPFCVRVVPCSSSFV